MKKVDSTHLIRHGSILLVQASPERFQKHLHLLAVLEPDTVSFHDLHPFRLVEALSGLGGNHIVNRLACGCDHVAHGITPRVDNGIKFLERSLGSGEQGKHVHWCRALAETLEEAIAYLLREGSEFGRTPAVTKEADEGAAGTTFEVGVLDVIKDGEFEDAGSTAGALAAPAATGAPFSASDSLVLGELEEGVEEAV